jgi:serine/threonine protein kinase
MTMSKCKANSKKMKHKAFLKKTDPTYDPDEGTLSDDDIAELEETQIGTVLNNEYILIKYISKGSFSRVWQVYHVPTNTIKVAKIYFDNDIDEFKIERNILTYLDDYPLEYNIKSIEVFSYSENGKQYNVIIQPHLGYSIYDIAECNPLNFTLKEAKHITRNLLLSLRELHKLDILHSDIKLSNFLTDYYDTIQQRFNKWILERNYMDTYTILIDKQLPDEYDIKPSEKRKKIMRKCRHRAMLELGSLIKQQISDYIQIEMALENDEHPAFDIENMKMTLIDYNASTFKNKLQNEEQYQIRAFRSPENILGYPIDFNNEVWAVGCFLWKLLTNEYLFEPELVGSSNCRDREQLAKMYSILGKMNSNYIVGSPNSNELVEENGKIIGYRKINKRNIVDILSQNRPDFLEKERFEIANFLNNLWNYDVNKRLSIEQCIDDPFLII